MKRITSLRPSNAHVGGQLVRPGRSTTVSDEVAASLEPSEWRIEDADAASSKDAEPLEPTEPTEPTTPPEVQTRPAKAGRTRKR